MAGEADAMVDLLAEILGVDRDRALQLSKSRSTRMLRYRDIAYLVLRRDMYGHYEGTTILYHIPSGDYMVVEGYPHIQRILLLGVAVPRHFIDNVYVEEKMDGYNVRIVRFRGRLLALTRGGYVCPYTTAKARKLYGRNLESLIDELDGSAVVAGEAVGAENPYTRFHYPEAPSWDLFVFDLLRDGGREPVPVDERRQLVSGAGLRNVPLHGVFEKHDIASIRRVLADLEQRGREGVVLKDPFYRVPPLKYTTSYINVSDIREGMKFPFDEGHTFIFPRVLRQIFLAYEEGWNDDRLSVEAERLGRALLAPALESLKRRTAGGKVAEEFTLTFDSMEELEEYLAHAASLGVQAVVVSLEYDGQAYRARLVKAKKTHEVYGRILRSGLSPLD